MKNPVAVHKMFYSIRRSKVLDSISRSLAIKPFLIMTADDISTDKPLSTVYCRLLKISLNTVLLCTHGRSRESNLGSRLFPCRA